MRPAAKRGRGAVCDADPRPWASVGVAAESAGGTAEETSDEHAVQHPLRGVVEGESRTRGAIAGKTGGEPPHPYRESETTLCVCCFELESPGGRGPGEEPSHHGVGCGRGLAVDRVFRRTQEDERDPRKERKAERRSGLVEGLLGGVQSPGAGEPPRKTKERGEVQSCQGAGRLRGRKGRRKSGRRRSWGGGHGLQLEGGEHQVALDGVAAGHGATGA